MLTNEHICVIMIENVKEVHTMSKESKIFSPTTWGVQETISHYESFGWELLSINGNQIVMARETQNPVYSQLVKFQDLYEQLDAKYKSMVPPMPPKPLNPVNYKGAIIAFLCLIIPGVLYVAYRINKKNQYNMELADYNIALDKYNAEREAILAQMKEKADQSRVVFFARQN